MKNLKETTLPFYVDMEKSMCKNHLEEADTPELPNIEFKQEFIPNRDEGHNSQTTKIHLDCMKHPVYIPLQPKMRETYIPSEQLYIEENNRIFYFNKGKKLLCDACFVLTKEIHLYGDKANNDNLNMNYQTLYEITWISNSVPSGSLIFNNENILHAHIEVQKHCPTLVLIRKDKKSLDYIWETYFRDLISYYPRCIEIQHPKTSWIYVNGSYKYIIGYEKQGRMHRNVIPNEYRIQAIMNGLSFLNLSDRFSKELYVIFMFAHSGFLQLLFEKAKMKFSNILYIKGPTGCFKTSLIQTITGVLDDEKTDAIIPLTFTSLAGARNVLNSYTDQIVSFDDNYADSYAGNTEMNKIIELVIRIVSEGNIPRTAGEYAGSVNYSEPYRGSAIITGESMAGIIKNSSINRLICVELSYGMINPSRLKIFQDNRDILRNYFSLFIDFLENNFDNIVSILINDSYRHSNQSYIFKVPRYNAAMEGFWAIAHIITGFLLKEGVMPEDETNQLHDYLIASAYHVIKQNEDNYLFNQSETQFLQTLYEMFHSKYILLADNEYDFMMNQGNFIGFIEDGLINLSNTPLFNEVNNYYMNKGEFKNVDHRYIKQKLAENGILILYNDYSEHPYTRRITKNYKKQSTNMNGQVVEERLSRPHILSLNMKKIEDILGLTL